MSRPSGDRKPLWANGSTGGRADRNRAFIEGGAAPRREPAPVRAHGGSADGVYPSIRPRFRVLLANLSMSVRDLARAAGISPSAAAALSARDAWPKNPEMVSRIEAWIKGLPGSAFLSAQIGAEGVAARRAGQRLARTKKTLRAAQKQFKAGEAIEASPGTTPGTGHSSEEPLMLIQKQSLTPAARDYWGLAPDALAAPWEPTQVFQGAEMRVVVEHMRQKALYGGMLAVIGESGSGKTTLKDLLVTDLSAEGVVSIEPHTQRMEENDKAGKTLKGGDLVAAIMGEIAPAQAIRRTAEAQLKQVAACLAVSLAEHHGRRHVLIIDEAHALPKPTLRHLKRFLELKDPAKKGLQRPLLSMILLGQPELAVRLSPYDMDVREVWQRCEIVHLPPLNKGLEAYLRHRLGKAADAFGAEAVLALAEKLSPAGRESSLYPLAVDNWLAVMLNESVEMGKTITAGHVERIYKTVERRARGVR
jgi:type II secretory pathway predicted ATPase ExeA